MYPVRSAQTKYSGKPWTISLGQTKDTYTRESSIFIRSVAHHYGSEGVDLIRCNELREPFPNENSSKRQPEELDTLFLKEDALATMEGIEQLDGRKEIRENNVCRVDEEGTHHTL